MRKNAILAGTGFEGREKIIRKYLYKNPKVILIRDPKNIYDSNAIEVCIETPILFGLLGRSVWQIGYIKATTAKSLARRMDSGVVFTASIESYWAPPDREHPRVTIEITDEI